MTPNWNGLGADHSTIIFRDNHSRRAGPADGIRRWPVTGQFAKGRTIAWVLDIDEHGFHIRRPANTSHFTIDRTGQETFDLSGFTIRHQHLVIAKWTSGLLATTHIGLDP